MKLEFESNTSTFTPVGSDFPVRTESDTNSVEVSKMLLEGIAAAQDGKAAEARSLLLRVTEADPNNEKAWLWLASISEYPEELLVFLNSVLNINPDNARAIEWAKATKSLLSKTFVQRGIDAAGEQEDFAKQCFLQAIVHDNNNEMAWLWLASISSSDDEKSANLQKVLSINPDNATAKFLLESIVRKNHEMLFQKVVEFAANDENHLALDALQEYFHQSSEVENAWLLKSFLVGSFDEKLMCFDKVLEENPANNLAQMNAVFLRSMLEKVESKEVENEAQMPESKVTQLAEVNEVENYSPQNHQVSQYPKPEEADYAPSAELAEPQAEEIQVVEVESNEAAEINFEAQAESPEESEDAASETGYAFYEVEEANDFAKTPVFYADESEGEDYAYAEYESNPDAYENVEELPQVYAFQETTEVSAQPEITDVGELNESEVAMESNSENHSPDVCEIEASESVAVNNYSHLLGNDENSAEDVPASFEETVMSFDENVSQPQEEAAFSEAEAPRYFDEENAFQPQMEMSACSFCDAENEQQSLVCGLCSAVLTLSDLEMVLANQKADKEMIGNAVCRMEAEKEHRELSANEMTQLALGYLNLGNLSNGLNFLNEAAKINPDDIVLSSQVNALKIRLTEIEKQKDIYDLMPKNLTILVVDDSATVRKLISGKLEKSGHEVVCAMDGIDALEKIKEIVPDLVLLDINMPRMDGYQVCKMIRSNEATKDVPVVMISGKDGFFDKVRGRMAGTTGYITKPFGPETLMKTVETYIV